MTTPATGRSLTNACDGVTRLFNLPASMDPADVAVILLDSATDPNSAGTILSEGTDYIVGGGDPHAGQATITTTLAYPVGNFLRRYRTTSRKQDVEIAPNQGLPAATQEGVYDRLSLIDEEHDDDIGRAVRVNPGETLGVVPAKAARSGFFAGWDADGNWAALSGSGADGALRTDLAASGGAALVGFIATGAGALARSVQSKLREALTSLGDVGGNGDGVTLNDAALAAGPTRKGVGVGIFKTSLASAALAGIFIGEGQIKDAANNLRAPWFAAISAAPASLSVWDSSETAFNGDRKTFFSMERRITGAATLGTPATGYQENPDLASISGYLYVGSGHNQQNGGNDGRTGIAQIFLKTDNYSATGGDATNISLHGIVNGSRAGATSFLAMPALCFLNGSMKVAADGNYGNAGEFDIDCSGKDAAAVGWVININRTVGDTSAGLGALTSAFRGQSIGSYAVDSVLSGSGPFKVGVDLTPVAFTSSNAALATPLGARWYLGAASSDGFKATGLGGHYLGGNSGGYFEAVWNSVSALQVSDTKVNCLVPLQLPTKTVATLPPASSALNGTRLYVSDANSNVRFAAVAGGGANVVCVECVAAAWRIA